MLLLVLLDRPGVPRHANKALDHAALHAALLALALGRSNSSTELAFHFSTPTRRPVSPDGSVLGVSCGQKSHDEDGEADGGGGKEEGGSPHHPWTVGIKTNRSRFDEDTELCA
jgi:hypothetical protein